MFCGKDHLAAIRDWCIKIYLLQNTKLNITIESRLYSSTPVDGYRGRLVYGDGCSLGIYM